MIVPGADMARAREFYGALPGQKAEAVAETRTYFSCGGVVLACVNPAEYVPHGAPQAERGFRPNPDYLYFAVADWRTGSPARRRRARASSARSGPTRGESGRSTCATPFRTRSASSTRRRSSSAVASSADAPRRIGDRAPRCGSPRGRREISSSGRTPLQRSPPAADSQHACRTPPARPAGGRCTRKSSSDETSPPSSPRGRCSPSRPPAPGSCCACNPGGTTAGCSRRATSTS